MLMLCVLLFLLIQARLGVIAVTAPYCQRTTRHPGRRPRYVTVKQAHRRPLLLSNTTLHSFCEEEEPEMPSKSNPDTTTVKDSQRRHFLLTQVLTTTTTTAAVVLSTLPHAANADPSTLSTLQSPLQDALAPGNWIGQFLGLNARSVTWTFDNTSPAQVSQALVQTLQSLSTERKRKLYMPNFQITLQQPNHVHVLTWTAKEWLDSLDVTIVQSTVGADQHHTGTVVAHAKFYATGFLPTLIPGAPVFNTALFWIPFASPGPREMLQDFRLRALEGLLRQQLQATTTTATVS